MEAARGGGGLFGVRSLVESVQSGARLSALRARVIRKAAENGGKLLSVELSLIHI